MSQLQLVNFEQAKRLKKLGFDWCDEHYYAVTYNRGVVLRTRNLLMTDTEIIERARGYTAPTVALALKWFRDVKGIYVDGGFYVTNKNWRFYYGEIKDTLTEKRTDEFDNYEAAESAVLYALLHQFS